MPRRGPSSIVGDLHGLMEDEEYKAVTNAGKDARCHYADLFMQNYAAASAHVVYDARTFEARRHSACHRVHRGVWIQKPFIAGRAEEYEGAKSE